MATIEENATVGADWETNLQNKPATLDILINALNDAGVIGVSIDSDGRHLRFEFAD